MSIAALTLPRLQQLTGELDEVVDLAHRHDEHAVRYACLLRTQVTAEITRRHFTLSRDPAPPLGLSRRERSLAERLIATLANRCDECGSQMTPASGCERLVDGEMVPVAVLECECGHAEILDGAP